MRILKIICRIFYFSGALFISCEHFVKTESICFSLPEKADGRVIYSRKCKQKQLQLKTQDSFYLELDKNDACAVLAFTSDTAHPYGAIYPFEETLSKESAFAAEILHTLTVNSSASNQQTKLHLSRFNWKRFLEETRALDENVWRLNKKVIMQKIACGTFKKTDLKLK